MSIICQNNSKYSCFFKLKFNIEFTFKYNKC